MHCVRKANEKRVTLMREKSVHAIRSIKLITNIIYCSLRLCSCNSDQSEACGL